MSQKSYNNTPTVYIIPTPIGNMEDITIRAVNTLKLVDVIFCEDTRVTSLLLNHLGIKKKLISSHKFNEDKNDFKLLEYLKDNKNIGIVTDRGTPIISDPGYELVKVAIENNYNVVSLPGPTAFVPALTSSGLSPMPFTFYGFLSNKKTKRIKELDNLKNREETLIFYEAPHRIVDTLEDMLNIFGDRNISISREISKKFEEIYRGKISVIKKQMLEIKGEIVIVVLGNTNKVTYDNLTIIEHVNLYIKEGIDKKEAIKLAAKDRNMKKSDVYNIYNGG